MYHRSSYVHVHMPPFLKAYKYEAVYVDETCTFMGRQTSELGATMPIKFTTPSKTVVGILIGKVRDADTTSSDVIEDETDNDMDWNLVSHKKKNKKSLGHSEDTRSDTHRHKRKRRSAGGASNFSPKYDDIGKPNISNETFKNYSTDEKLGCIFSVRSTLPIPSIATSQHMIWRAIHHHPILRTYSGSGV